ncbi:MAG: D-glycero-beta-D-manno-heptose 1-phosphate adenylyltransferase [Chitinophagales bacterium]
MEWPEWITHKILDQHALQARLKHWRVLGGKIVFTNGCFDILHAGHLKLLLQCRELGDYVIVGLNSNSSVKQLKGSERPVNDQQHRAAMLAALLCVDAVVIFDEATPENLISTIVPNVLVKGGDYRPEQIAGSGFVRAHGGEVVIVPLLEGKSTTAILKGK